MSLKNRLKSFQIVTYSVTAHEKQQWSSRSVLELQKLEQEVQSPRTALVSPFSVLVSSMPAVEESALKSTVVNLHVVYAVDFDKYRMTCVHHKHHETVPGKHLHLFVHPSPLPLPGQPLTSSSTVSVLSPSLTVVWLECASGLHFSRIISLSNKH